MTKLLFSLEDKLFDIRRDAVFKAVFTKETQESRGALSKLVSALIRRELYIVSVLANEPPVTNINDRQIRYDINCRANNGELIIVEKPIEEMTDSDKWAIFFEYLTSKEKRDIIN